MKRSRIKVKEKDLQKSIIEWLDAKRIFWFRNNTGAFRREDGHFYRFGSVGAPDIICVAYGVFVGIEVKGSGGRQSPEQRGFQEKLEQARGIYILAHRMEDVTNSMAFQDYDELSPLQKAA